MYRLAEWYVPAVSGTVTTGPEWYVPTAVRVMREWYVPAAVRGVAHERVVHMRQMHPYLMRPPRQQLHLLP